MFLLLLTFLTLSTIHLRAVEEELPNLVLTMSDDQGWAEVSYNGHPILETPNLDAMAANGLRLDRFYAASAVCSPTRASFMTGRDPNRCGVPGHGKPMAKQERTIGQLAQLAGYRTAFFGKWHLNGVGGRAKPVPADDPLSPGEFGFQEWKAMNNYYDLGDTLGSPEGLVPTPSDKDTSVVLAEYAIDYMRRQVEAGERFLVVIWYPSPHGRYDPTPKFQAPYPEDREHLGEIAGVDASIGMLRQGLRDLGVAENTLLLFCSDNGTPADKGRHNREEHGLGPLRGTKGTVWEGGIRVPGIVEWPARIKAPRRSDMITCTNDLYPTLEAILQTSDPEKPRPLDGISLLPLFDNAMQERPVALGFEYRTWAWMEGPWKLHKVGNHEASELYKPGQVVLHNLVDDIGERHDVAAKHPERVQAMQAAYEAWKQSVQQSARGADY